MKICPVCKARCFDDMEVCYGCMHRFVEEPSSDAVNHEISEPPTERPQAVQTMAIPMLAQVPQAPQASEQPPDATEPHVPQPAPVASAPFAARVVQVPELARPSRQVAPQEAPKQPAVPEEGRTVLSGGGLVVPEPMPPVPSFAPGILPGYRLEISLVPIGGRAEESREGHGSPRADSADASVEGFRGHAHMPSGEGLPLVRSWQ